MLTFISEGPLKSLFVGIPVSRFGKMFWTRDRRRFVVYAKEACKFESDAICTYTYFL
jgi:hypothetical protein